MTDETGTTTRTYDELNRAMPKSVPNFGLCEYTYDITLGVPAGCIAEASTDPKGNVTRKVYDRVGRLLEILADGNTSTYTYYDNGSLQKVEYDDGSSETYTYTDDYLLSTLVNKKADGTTIESYA